MNKLIFGKDDTKNIVNITLKNNEVYLYSETDGKVSCEKFDYTPWFLSSKPISKFSEKLKGNQFYRFLTSVDTAKYHELNSEFHRDKWLPRSIEECFTLCEGVTYYKGMKVPDVSILSFDIETSGLVMDHTSQVFIISNTLRKNGQTIRKLFTVDQYANHAEMIDAWCAWVCDVDPSIMCGHNILSYDLPYLNNIAPLKLGRDGSWAEFAEKTSKFRKDGSQQYDYHNVRVTGREIIDTFFLSIKYDIGRDFPSYGLKPIIKHLGLEKEDREFVEAGRMRQYYENRNEVGPASAMWVKAKKYAAEDSDDALKLYDMMIPAYFYLAQSIPKTMQQMINEASGSQLDALMIRSYLQDGYSQPKTSGKAPFEGAISMGRPGVYDYVCKADVASLYPSIMLEYDIHDEKKDPYNYTIKMLTYFRDERLKNKQLAKETGDKYFDDMQNAQKIMINSMYGFLGAGFLLYNYPDGASAVTRHGRQILLKGVEFVTGYTLERVVKDITNEGKDTEEISYEYVVGEKVSEGRGFTLVNVDTDSFSITKNQEITSDEFRALLKDLNEQFPKLIKWEDDGIYSRVIVIRAKNYVLVKNGKTKYKGSAITDQKKEPALTEMLENMIQALLNDETAALPLIYRSYIREALDIQFIHRWVTKKTVTKSVLSPNRLTEQKILNAINESIDNKIIEGVQEGDKVWLYNSINGMIQDTKKGQLVFYKNGDPKMIPNYVLKDVRLWKNDEDKMHYVDRTYATVQILSNVIDMDQFLDYTLKSNRELLKQLDKKTVL